MTMKSRFHDTQGSAIIELALTTPLFILIIMGTFELGRVAYSAIEVVNAARAGASFGSVNYGNAFSPDGQADTVQAAKNDAPDIANLSVTTPLTYCVCETLDTTSNVATFSSVTSCQNTTIKSCTGESSTTAHYVLDYVKVDSQAVVDPLIHVPGLPSTFTLQGSSRLRVLQN